MEFSAIVNKDYWPEYSGPQIRPNPQLRRATEGHSIQPDSAMKWMLLNPDHQNSVVCAGKRVTLNEDALLYLLYPLANLVKVIKLLHLLMY